MKNSSQGILGKDFHDELENNYNWLIYAGVMLSILSITTMLIAYNTYAKNIGNAFLFLIICTIYIIHSLKFWYRKVFGFILHICLAFIYWVMSIEIIIVAPILSSILFFMLSIAFIISGIFRVRIAVKEGLIYLGWGWTFLSGLINLILVAILLLTFLDYPLKSIIYTASTDIFFTGMALFFLGVNFKYRYQKAGSNVIQSLDNILQFLYDSSVCFKKHVYDVDNNDLQTLFKLLVISRNDMISDIQNELVKLGVHKPIKGTLLGKTHIIFENIKSIIYKGDALAITNEVRRGENVLIDYYKKALKLSLSPSQKAILIQHLSKIEDDIKQSDLISVQ